MTKDFCPYWPEKFCQEGDCTGCALYPANRADLGFLDTDEGEPSGQRPEGLKTVILDDPAIRVAIMRLLLALMQYCDTAETRE